MSLISQRAWQSLKQDKSDFQSAKPFRYVAIDNFFEREFCQRVLDEFPTFEDRFALNEMGQVGGKAARADVGNLSAAFRELDTFIQSKEFLDYISDLTGIPDLRYDPLYVGGGTHENRDGQSLAPHVDFNHHPATKEHRRLNLIVYLNHEWDSAWGGELTLQEDPWRSGDQNKKTISPMFNRAVIFETTEASWHGFDTIRMPVAKKHLSRKSFAIYLYTKDRPQEESAPQHATIYVPHAMPRGWSPGRTLSKEDLVLLENRFADLLGHLRFLYEREKMFVVQLEEAKKTLRLPVQGYANQNSAPIGYWADGWVAREFRLSFVPLKHLKGVDLSIFVPREISGDQILLIEVNGERWEHVAAKGPSTINLRVRIKAEIETQLTVRATNSFTPSQAARSRDERELAWLLRTFELVQ